MFLFHKHSWQLLSSRQGTRHSRMGYSCNEPFTLLLYKCSKCGKFKTEEMLGHWEFEELAKKGD